MKKKAFEENELIERKIEELRQRVLKDHEALREMHLKTRDVFSGLINTLKMLRNRGSLPDYISARGVSMTTEEFIAQCDQFIFELDRLLEKKEGYAGTS